MRIIDETGMADVANIRKMIRFVRPPSISGFDVVIRWDFITFHGSAYYDGSWSHKVINEDGSMDYPPYIVIHVMPKTHGIRRFPHTWHKRGAYLEVTVRSEEEATLFLIAHELRHIWQYKFKGEPRAPGSRGIVSERDADIYGIKMLRLWRSKKVAERRKKATVAQ
jgi:hypothetical protein